MQLSAEQQTVLNYMLSGVRSVFLTGNAGTGKSTIIRAFREKTKGDKGIVYLAPTGIAALNIQGATVHSFFKVPIGILDSTNLEVSSRFRPLAKETHTIVIDEISMVRADLMDAMDFLLRRVCSRNKPFGGKRLIMIGDLCQLPPVVKKDEVPYFQHRFGSKSGWCFQSFAFQQLSPKVFNLQESFRQKGDATFVELLNRIRDGDGSAVHPINEAAKYGLASNEVIVLTGTNKQAQEYNQKRLDALTTPLITYTGKAWGKFFPHLYPVPEALQLRVGARVIATRNTPDFLNGSIGTVKKMGETGVVVNFDSGGDAEVEPLKWDNLEYEIKDGEVKTESKGTYTQLPLKLSWGLTIHKSQGQGFPSAFIHLGKKGAFAHGQLYVALSRIESLAGLYLHSKLSPSDVITDPDVENFLAGGEVPFSLELS
jgi:ATP-dependent DNA helicase PIF1